AATRWMSWGSRHAATGRPVRRGSGQAAAERARGAAQGSRIPPWAGRQEGDSGWAYGAMTPWVLLFRGELDADAAVADEAASLVEHRLSAHPEVLLGAIHIEPAEEKIEE